MRYHYETATIEGFIQQLAVAYVSRGYWFYVTGIIPEGRDPRQVDEKLIEKYGLEVSKFTRARRKAVHLANVQYLRHSRFFVLVATGGDHRFYSPRSLGGELERIRDCREIPIKFGSYAVSHRGGHASVRIEQGTFMDLKAFFLERACHWSKERLEKELHRLPFEPYVPIRGQLIQLWRGINGVRKTAQLEPLGFNCLRLRRRIVKPFVAGAYEVERTTRAA